MSLTFCLFLNTVVTLLLFVDLGRMYNLVSRITDGLGELKKLLETHIHNQGLAAIEKCGEAALNVRTANNSLWFTLTCRLTRTRWSKRCVRLFQDPKVYVQTTLDVHKKYNALVMSAFNNDAGFVAALDKVRIRTSVRQTSENITLGSDCKRGRSVCSQACGRFINNNAVTRMAQSSSKSPELLARYCDSLLKKRSGLFPVCIRKYNMHWMKMQKSYQTITFPHQ